MGRGDNRKSMKMRQRERWRKKKERELRKKKGAAQPTGTQRRTTKAPTGQS